MTQPTPIVVGGIACHFHQSECACHHGQWYITDCPERFRERYAELDSKGNWEGEITRNWFPTRAAAEQFAKECQSPGVAGECKSQMDCPNDDECKALGQCQKASPSPPPAPEAELATGPPAQFRQWLSENMQHYWSSRDADQIMDHVAAKAAEIFWPQSFDVEKFKVSFATKLRETGAVNNIEWFTNMAASLLPRGHWQPAHAAGEVALQCNPASPDVPRCPSYENQRKFLLDERDSAERRERELRDQLETFHLRIYDAFTCPNCRGSKQQFPGVDGDGLVPCDFCKGDGCISFATILERFDNSSGELTAATERAERAEETTMIVLGSLQWNGDGYEWTGGQYDYRMTPAEAVACTQRKLDTLRNQLSSIHGALADAGDITIRGDGDYAASVRELVQRVRVMREKLEANRVGLSDDGQREYCIYCDWPSKGANEHRPECVLYDKQGPLPVGYMNPAAQEA